MALDRDIIKANPVLATLPDEAVEALITVSRNATEAVVSNRIAGVTSDYENKLKGATDSVHKAFLSKLNEVTGIPIEENDDIETFAKKVVTVKDSSAKDWQDKFNASTSQLKELAKALAAEKEQGEKSLKDFKTQVAFDTASQNLQFVAGLPESAAKALTKVAIADIKAKYTPDFTPEGVLVFRDASGALMLNKENSLNPYTAKELLMLELSDTLDKGRKVEGAGTGEPKGANSKQSASTTVDVSEAKTQEQAVKLIENYLASQGLTRTNPKYHTEVKRLYTECKVADIGRQQ